MKPRVYKSWPKYLSYMLVAILLSSCWSDSGEDLRDKVEPPVAETRPKVLSAHGDERIDEYYWIRDDKRQDPEVLRLLQAENEYTAAVMSEARDLQDTLYQEITSRLTSNDRTVPVRKHNYLYFREFREGGEYPVYIRRKDRPGSADRVLLDVNKLSQGHDYYQVGNWSVSHGQDIVAFAEDNIGRRQYTLRFKHLDTGEYLDDEINNVSSDIAWAGDNETIFYVKKHPRTLLPYRVYRHRVGTPVDDDELIYEEANPEFYTSVYTARSNQYVVISARSTNSSEIRLIDAHKPEHEPDLFLPREPDHEYRVRHVDDTFYVITNWRAKNFRLMKVAESDIGDKSHWTEVIPHRDDVLLQDIEVFEEYLVLNERIAGLSKLRVIGLKDDMDHYVDLPDPAYTVSLHSNPEPDTHKMRYVYSSLTMPETIVEFDMRSQSPVVLKQKEIPGDFDQEAYKSERIFITARDGTEVPVSLLYRKELRDPGENPLYLYAYGSYGFSTNPTFESRRLSLLDRSFVYAIVHVRGGQEMGREWYEDGKLLNKRNTFTDFIDATRELVDRGYGAEDKVFAAGASAGGMLMGVVANEAPHLYRGIIAHVPFVDVVTTMLDESLPLTAGEYNEWGNPEIKKYYDYMLSYSPYDQVKAQHYPHMFVTTGLHDSQVQYFEPVKWVARLRKMKLDDNRLLLDINFNTGHGGASGRYERYRTDALEYAFILDILNNHDNG
ncbi:MAG: S9 family peptidase [Pseudomonadales bacterium]